MEIWELLPPQFFFWENPTCVWVAMAQMERISHDWLKSKYDNLFPFDQGSIKQQSEHVIQFWPIARGLLGRTFFLIKQTSMRRRLFCFHLFLSSCDAVRREWDYWRDEAWHVERYGWHTDGNKAERWSEAWVTDVFVGSLNQVWNCLHPDSLLHKSLLDVLVTHVTVSWYFITFLWTYLNWNRYNY